MTELLTRVVIDLFAGPGGWDIAARALGLDPIGVEWDRDACATRALNGLATIRGDVSSIPSEPFGHVQGLIASPPCPQFSSAGKGHGRRLIAEVAAAVTDAMNGLPIGPHRERMVRILADEALDRGDLLADSETAAVEAALTAEPARWIHDCTPRWVAFEQVPAVLPIWQHYARELQARGYSVAVGIVSAEQYGVPQTRRRAVLVASLDRRVELPHPTHQRYVPGEAAGAGADCEASLFGPGLLPWVAMADALGRGMNARPAVTIARGSDKGGGFDMAGGSGARATVQNEIDAGRWVVRTGQNTGEVGVPYERDSDAPAPTVTGRADLWSVGEPAPDMVLNPGRSEAMPNRSVRPIDKPAPTLDTAVGTKWTLEEIETVVLNPGRGSTQRRDCDSPAPTVTPASGGQWVFDRPATTIMGDSRVFQPGGHHEPGKQSQNSIRLTVPEAAALQSFPLGYQFAGSNMSRFKQIGNAVPPLLARAILATLTT